MNGKMAFPYFMASMWCGLVGTLVPDGFTWWIPLLLLQSMFIGLGIRKANSLIGPRIGLPKLPVIEFDKEYRLPSRSDGTYFKTHDVVKYAAGRPFAWVDDEISTHDDLYVAAFHDGPAKLLKIDPVTGLMAQDFDTLSDWAASLETI